MKRYLDLNNENRDPGIPGTKCPVSAQVLEGWYRKGMSLSEISERIEELFSIKCSMTSISNWLNKIGVFRRTPSQYMRIAYKKNPGKWKKSKDEMDILREKARLSIINNPELIKKRNACLRLGSKNIKKTGVLKNCPVCKKEFYVVKSDNRENNCCSRSCKSTLQHRNNRPRIVLNGLICPNCFCPSIRAKGRRVCAGKIIRNWFCVSCTKETLRPIIELGLRQDLEAAGALDDGRILASAFQKREEAS